jgi:hypothetical protein
VGASITLVTPSIALEPGTQASVEVRLRNTGAVVDEFTLDVLGDTAAWATVDPPSLSLFPDTEGSVRIVFRPPRLSTTPAGQLVFGLRARSREDPAGSAVEEGTVDVGAFVDPSAELVPRSSRGSGGTTHEVAVDNRGNARLSAEIAGADADRLVRFDIKPPGLVVEPGGAAFAKVKVRPARRFWRGQPKPRPFQVFVTPEGGGPIQLDGTLLQESILPPWFGRAVLALIAALILLVLAWFFLLRPAINSAVTDAVASPIASLRNDVNSALSGAGLPTMGPAGSPAAAPTATATAAPGATPSPTPTAPSGGVIPGVGTPVSGVLDVQNTSYPAPNTFYITDLVFMNPSGVSGGMAILSDTSPLIRLRLENFRDYDLHFVVPVVIQAGHQLNLSLSCSSGTCDPTVLYSGYLRP